MIWSVRRSVCTSTGVVFTSAPAAEKVLTSPPVPHVVSTASVPGKGAPGSRGRVVVPVAALRSVSSANAMMVESLRRSVSRVKRKAVLSVPSAMRYSTRSAALPA